MTSAGSMTAAITSALIMLLSATLAKGDGVWDQWSDYSPCSRSCGGGVQSRTRGCLHMGSGQGNGCVGPGEEYMSCETEVCPRGSEDFRSMQCSKFNQIPMILNGHSRRYEWVPHFDEKNRCALKCHASGTSIVRVLEEKVVDGTQCDSPEKFGVCVGGVCQDVGCDRLIGSVMKDDKCRVCGGDGSACRTEGGVFSQSNLNVGYHEFLTIPEGSTSINITKMKPSHSYLAMKSERGNFYINGGRDRTSQKAFAGTIFQYYNAVGTDTTDTESILARGPINESLIVMLVSRGSNPGVKHEYSTPQALVEKAGDTAERFTWVYGRWTRCSQDCGTGYQLRAVSCMDRESGATVNDRSCNIRIRPRGNQTCNMGTCAEDRTNGYSWVLGHWDECSVVCGMGEQTQLAYCQEKGTMGQTIYVSDDICLRYLGEKPLYKRVCRGEAGCPHWSTGAWNECGVTCGLGYQTRRVFCHRLSETEESVKVPDSECKIADRPDARKPCQLAQCPGRRIDRVRELEGRNETVVPVKCSETQYGCCPDGVTRALDKQHTNCPHAAGINECKLERSRGPCANYTLKWYYDDQTSLCNMFWYGGCGGNDNRFNTEEECQYKCVTSDGSDGAPCSAGSQRCQNIAKCVPKARLCDGFNDCGDNSDEQNCATITENQCGEGRSMCRSVKKCVSDRQKCDGYDDCGDNSDEENCGTDTGTSNQCGAGRSMCRGVKKCVSDRQRCDGYDDCGDNSDEENCDDGGTTNQCGAGSSMCRGVKKCVSDAQRCDGYDDCGDNSDEENCGTDTGNQCGAGRSMCRSVKKCVSDRQRCDGYDDCGDNSDEENCDTNTGNQCGEGMKMCRGVKKCVAKSRWCDGYDDCGENSDEDSCIDQGGNQCGAGRSMCRGVKKCVSDRQRCDGYDDCGDNSDEENCDTNTGNKCGEGMKMCRGVKKCVAMSKWCDGYDDCGDNSDEDTCIDQGGYWDNQCGEGSSMCRGVKKCVADVRRCDGRDDCGDNSDEEGCDDDNISIECATSDHGCCPDGQTAATGPNQEGCPSIPATGCSTSQYGCCQDQVTSASGPNQQGCPQTGVFDTASCSLEKVKGDCSQWEAQWHFSTTTGACAQFWYGGCGGNANRFPNKTECETSCVHVKGAGLCRLPMSKGPCRASKPRYYFDHMSGECKKFNYGGCRGNSNRFRSKAECEMKCSDSTYIDSEDDDSPRCKTSRYGCCPDMKTPARGPNKYGCVKSCKTSRYGCCDDGITAAEGPQQYGCEESSGMEPCEESVYGCCSDGVTRASGYNQEGCTDQDVVILSTKAPIHTTNDPCGQEKDSTRCKDFVVKWFWDREKQRCDRFWFGGCEGSMNKFDSEEDCLGRCRNSIEPVVNKCELPRETGPCRALLTRWHFDTYSQQCMTFTYGGCQGNENNFLSESECRRHCGGRVATPAPTQAPTQPPTTTTTISWGSRPEKTSVEMTGEKYVKEGRSIRIQCEAATSTTSSSRIIEWFFNGNRLQNSDRIQISTSLSGYTVSSKLSIQGAMKVDSGTYYCRSLPDGDVQTLYITVADVSYEVTTVPPTTTPYPPDFYTTARPRPTQPREVCMQEKATGRCYASIPKWFYDHKDGVCREFTYGGCEGNENNFNTKEECDTFCRPEEICVLPRETGRCRALIPRWTYDSTSHMCIEFNYGGCGGNPNNFESKDSCERRCRTKHINKPDKSGGQVCSLPRAGGTCEGYNILWYYDKDYKRCSRFIYTGCGGNGNRFQSEDECQAACEGGEVVVTTPAPTKPPVRETAVCDMRPDNARCDGNNDVANYKIKWYYDYERRVCARFYYGGCGGNANRFDSRQECQTACVYGKKVNVVRTTPVPTTTTTTAPLHCRYSTHGCCQDGETTAVDEYHSNCYDGPNVIERRKGEDYEILVRPGSDVLINCRIHRMEDDLVMWFRDRTTGKTKYRFAVKTGFRSTLYNNGSLLIKGMKPEDGGVYSCQVSGGNNVPQIERYNVQVQIPLRILNSPKIIKIKPGDNAFLHCQVYGQPTPTVTWMTRGRPVNSAGRYRAFENGTLIISSAEESDAGEYECEAENGVSHMVKKKVQLRIREPVRAKLDPYKGKVIEGGTVRLRCRGSGYPRPTMHWERDGEKLTNGDKISVTGRELVIRNAAIEDSGIYTCVVKNHHHEARAATVVQVDMQPMSETCEDSLSKMKCKMIRTARLCGHRTFSKRCCETCASYRYR